MLCRLECIPKENVGVFVVDCHSECKTLNCEKKYMAIEAKLNCRYSVIRMFENISALISSGRFPTSRFYYITNRCLICGQRTRPIQPNVLCD